MVKQNNNVAWWVVFIVLALIVGYLIGSNISGNATRTSYNPSNVPVADESGSGTTSTTVTYQGVLDMFKNNMRAYDVGSTGSGWDVNGNGEITGEEVCNLESKTCVLVFYEYDNGGSAGKGTEPFNCQQGMPVTSENDPAQDILNVWCVITS